MPDYAPEAELAPRDVVARSIHQEMQKTSADHVLLDVTHLPTEQVTTRFPTIYRFCLDHGLNITTHPIPVAPAAHYLMGGVRTNTWGQTSLPCLYACGEVACPGVHGANRLASNSLLETLVFGKRVVQRTLDGDVPWQRPQHGSRDLFTTLPERPPQGEGPTPSLTRLQELMWQEAGIVRHREGLELAASVLSDWQRSFVPTDDRPARELAHLILLGRLLVEAALLREESRGAHLRRDFPDTSPQWERHIVLTRET
jgi:L-aspartate oxidase